MNNGGLFLRRCFFLSGHLSIRPFHLKGQLLDASEQPSRARGRNGSHLSCKYVAHKNVGGKEDLEGPPAGWAPGSPLSEGSWMSEHCCIVYRYLTQGNAERTVFLLKRNHLCMNI